jgi:hypothetical protein
MPVTNGYCTVDELKAWKTLDTTDLEAILEDAINAASRSIESFCQRRFWQDGTVGSPVARVFDAQDYCYLDLGAFGDLIQVTAFKTDDNRDGTYETTWSASTDYQLLPVTTTGPETYPFTSAAALNKSVPVVYERQRRGLIQITGVWGWSAVPADVHEACLMLANRLCKRRASPEGVAGWADFGVVNIRNTDPDVTRLLGPYRHAAAFGIG